MIGPVWRWVTNWRNPATIAFSVLVGVMVFSFFDARHARDQAFESLADARAAAARRIDAKDAELAELRQQVLDLAQRQTPVPSAPVTLARPRPVTRTTTTTRPPAGRSNTPTSPPQTAPPAPPSTQPTTTTQPSPPTTKPCNVSLPGVCI